MNSQRVALVLCQLFCVFRYAKPFQLVVLDEAGGTGLLAGALNNGLVEFVTPVSYSKVDGFVVPETTFGVPYIEFTASEATLNQAASFIGALKVAEVIGNVVTYPFRPNPSLSPDCQVNVNIKTYQPNG